MTCVMSGDSTCCRRREASGFGLGVDGFRDQISPTKTNAALEATQVQMDGFFSHLQYKCYLEEVASAGDCHKICPQLDSRVMRKIKTSFSIEGLSLLLLCPLQGYLADKQHPPRRTLQ